MVQIAALTLLGQSGVNKTYPQYYVLESEGLMEFIRIKPGDRQMATPRLINCKKHCRIVTHRIPLRHEF